MKTRFMLAGMACLFFTGLQPAIATIINYDVTNISGNTWEYNYTVNNDTLGFGIDEFTVYFDFGVYQNLSVISAPAMWDPVVVEPGNFLNNDGYFDSLALVSGIVPGDSLGGFSVRFDYLGAGNPAAQFFEIVDPVDFSVLDSGLTNIIPVPPAAWLFDTGLIGLIAVSRRKA